MVPTAILSRTPGRGKKGRYSIGLTLAVPVEKQAIGGLLDASLIRATIQKRGAVSNVSSCWL